MTDTHIIETSVYGVSAHHAQCQDCDWETPRYHRKSTAIRHAYAHTCDQGCNIKDVDADADSA